MHLSGYDHFTEIGRGGYGVVFKAFQQSLRRDVAIKVLRAGVMDGSSRQQFEGEAQALGALGGHPNIIEVHDFGFAGDGTPYLIMPFLDGGSLRERVQGLGRLGAVEAVDLGVKIAGALESAHRRGIVHGDVKPDNILFDDLGEPQLCDFGIAVLHHREGIAPGAGGLTPGFSAPEVSAGGQPTPSSDIYGLAISLSACLRGALPDMSRGSRGPNDDLRQRGLPEALVEALDYGMLPDPGQRARTAAEFGRVLIDVQRALDMPVTRMPMLPSDGPGVPGLLASSALPGAAGMSGVAAGSAGGDSGPYAEFGQLMDGPPPGFGGTAAPSGGPVHTPGSGGVADALGGGRTVARRVIPQATPDLSAPDVDGGGGASRRRFSRKAITAITSGVLAVLLLTGVGLWWFLLRDVPTWADQAATIYQRTQDPTGLQDALTADRGLAGDARVLGVWWSYADHCVALEYRDALGDCYDEAAEALLLAQTTDPRDLILTDDLDRSSVADGLVQGYDLGQANLDRRGTSLDLAELTSRRPGIDPGAFCDGRSCAGLVAQEPVQVRAPFERIADPEVLRDELTGLPDGVAGQATVIGLWWSMADWCSDAAVHDTIGPCYDRAAELAIDLSGIDPRTLVLVPADLERGSVTAALPGGYELGQQALDTTPTRVDVASLVIGRPSVDVVCTPDCTTIERELIKALPTEESSDLGSPPSPDADGAGSGGPDADAAGGSADGATSGADAAGLPGGHPAPSTGDHLVIVVSIGKSSGQDVLDGAVATARSNAERIGLDPARVRVVDSDTARYDNSEDPVGLPGFWGIVIVGYTDAADAQAGVSAWRGSYGDAKYRGQITEV